MKNREIWNQFSLILDYCKAGYRKTVVSAMGLSLLDGVRPFITTVLLGLLIDGVYAGASFPELLRLALTALGLECLCYCLSSILTEIHNQKHDFIYEQQNGLLNRRLLFMNYPHLEEAQTHTLLHTIRNAGTDHGLIGLVEAGPKTIPAMFGAFVDLSDEERQIVMLHSVSGFRFREIASFLQLPLNTVLSKHHRAMKRLRRQLSEEGI